MIAMHHRTLDPEMMKGRRILTEMPAVAVSVQIVRMHSGKLQGLHMYNILQGPGAGSPWV
jgi:hypothetical protein